MASTLLNVVWTVSPDCALRSTGCGAASDDVASQAQQATVREVRAIASTIVGRLEAVRAVIGDGDDMVASGL
ncbi:MAG: hypothetical protein V3R77_04060 [Candidatus Binatia bacterium]